MKNLILAAALALASAMPIATPSQAASVVISGDSAQIRYGDRDRHDGRRYDRNRHDNRRYDRHMQRRHNVVRDCYTKTVRHHRHGRTIIERVRVCR